MNYITTTDLRTQSPQLIGALKKGSRVSLIHRSKVVAMIQPLSHTNPLFDSKKFGRLVKALKLPITSPAQRKKRYRTHLLKKYG